MSTNTPIAVLEDGTISVSIKRPDDSIEDLSLDLLCLRLTCQEAEDAHKLHERSTNGVVQPTADFLRDLSSRFVAMGVTRCTPTIAWQLWVATIDAFNGLKKSTNLTPTSPSGTESTPAASPEPSGSDTSPTSTE